MQWSEEKSKDDMMRTWSDQYGTLVSPRTQWTVGSSEGLDKKTKGIAALAPGQDNDVIIIKIIT